MLRTLGADAVGMSTVLEAIAARWAGFEVCGVSLVTNAGRRLTGPPITHEEVLAAGAEAGPRLARVIRRFVADLPEAVPAGAPTGAALEPPADAPASGRTSPNARPGSAADLPGRAHGHCVDAGSARSGTADGDADGGSAVEHPPRPWARNRGRVAGAARRRLDATRDAPIAS